MKEALTVRDILHFQIGRADAIRKVASSSSAIWTGIALTLLTAFARNYDQTHISEKPALWLLGPLLFSAISGTWVYLISYGVCARLKIPDDDLKRPPLWTPWAGFMGAFWMTAPIAWLYAIPVERMFDSIGAAHANVTLLAIVAAWRVLLMARVMSIVVKAPIIRTLMWITIPASVEVVLLSVFGGTLAKRIAAGMGGMRNSPEEEVLLRAMDNASGIAFWGGIIAVLVLAVWRWRGVAEKWPTVTFAKAPAPELFFAAVCWMFVALPNQVQLARNIRVEALTKSDDYRGALDLMNELGEASFAPARPLPPKMFEWSSANEAFKLANATTSNDAPWIIEHSVHSLDDAVLGLTLPYYPALDSGDTISHLAMGIQQFRVDPKLIHEFLTRTNLPEMLADWRSKQTQFLSALRVAAEDLREITADQDSKEWYWSEIAEKLNAMGFTNPESPHTKEKSP